MNTNEIKILEKLKKLNTKYFNPVNPAKYKTAVCTAQIKSLTYYELGCVMNNMIKLCILALDHDAHKVPETGDCSRINLGLILETVLEMFPMKELEMLGEINDLLLADSHRIDE
ncbi:hypothetical protein BC749_1045 [Flavobacterium araucananum]|uniref:Uncharacterized protein n=1 Tax=Flavobacterium araucananum TaxID=946678 RepID=A0A227NJV2_9FLAO|nr:hypothetical protein [Flavobacterium araucananum]OXE97411.1 hypothetical protein B0A64_23375 [Flavobacterium araucananum]PWJ98865.1 hypothetical protein BC749_1045 [Flavobacterium araucananum]